MADEKGGMEGMFGEKKEPEKKPSSFSGITGMFSKHETGPSPYQMSSLSNQISNISRRLRMIEERYTNMRNKTQMTDQNMLQFNKEVNRGMGAVNSELVEIKRDFSDLKDKIRLIIKELKESAKSEDVKMLQKYIEMWEPLNFMTREEADRVIEEKVQEKLREMLDKQNI